MTKKSKQILKYVENQRSFWGKIKSISHHFTGLSVSKNCLRPNSALLKILFLTWHSQTFWICFQTYRFVFRQQVNNYYLGCDVNSSNVLSFLYKNWYYVFSSPPKLPLILQVSPSCRTKKLFLRLSAWDDKILSAPK